MIDWQFLKEFVRTGGLELYTKLENQLITKDSQWQMQLNMDPFVSILQIL